MQANDLIRACPVWCKGIRNGRELINEKNVPAKYYVYARKDGDEWIITDGASRKCDKVLIRKLYLDRCNEYTNEINGVDVQDKDGIAMAPDIILLEDDKKITDDSGNVLEIEARGIRQSDGVYFKVRDVSRGFKMDNLADTLGRACTHYTEHVDYVYFLCIDKGKPRKELFLTYAGFRRMVEVNRKNYSANMKKQMHDWLAQFDPIVDTNYKLNIADEIISSMKGYVYCVTANMIDFIKMGCWRSTLGALRARYITYYGADLVMHCVETNNARKLESMCHREFNKYRITNELFKKEHLAEYLAYMNANKHVIDTAE